jgi:hypothetical protein
MVFLYDSTVLKEAITSILCRKASIITRDSYCAPLTPRRDALHGECMTQAQRGTMVHGGTCGGQRHGGLGIHCRIAVNLCSSQLHIRILV